jgi:peptidoglycan/xylan/chitin deacetylase (PgdA/CDA1 family)
VIRGSGVTARLSNRWRRFILSQYGRRTFALKADVPYVSFTFDDFPRSAFVTGGRILEQHGTRGTFYLAMQLVNTETCVGQIASRDDLRALLERGHELGCHTFEHLDGRRCTTHAFERSIVHNRLALQAVVPDGRLEVFSYPLDGPNLKIKRQVGEHFVCC